NFPYVIGCLWNGREKPPESATNVVGPTGKVDRRVIKSRLGHTITIDDSDKPAITIVDKTGKNTIKLDSTTNKLSIEVAGDISLDAKGNISLDSKGKISLNATGQLTIQGRTMSIDGGPSLTVRGTTVAIN